MNSGTLDGQVVVVTGGGSGMGASFARRLASDGARLVINDVNEVAAGQVASEVGGEAAIFDVTDSAAFNAAIDRIAEHYGRLDVLINNAGISMRGLMEDGGTGIIPVIKKVMDINFYGAVYCTTFALPHLIKSKGVVVGVSSIAGYRGLPGRSGYSASKFALQGWLESLKTEVVEKGVHVMWVSPGFTASNIRNVALNKQGDAQGESPLNENELMDASTCANIIISAIAKRKRTVVMTFQGKQTVFLNKFFPSLADRLVRKFFFKHGELVK